MQQLEGQLAELDDNLRERKRTWRNAREQIKADETTLGHEWSLADDRWTRSWSGRARATARAGDARGRSGRRRRTGAVRHCSRPRTRRRDSRRSVRGLEDAASGRRRGDRRLAQVNCRRQDGAPRTDAPCRPSAKRRRQLQGPGRQPDAANAIGSGSAREQAAESLASVDVELQELTEADARLASQAAGRPAGARNDCGKNETGSAATARQHQRRRVASCARAQRPGQPDRGARRAWNAAMKGSAPASARCSSTCDAGRRRAVAHRPRHDRRFPDRTPRIRPADRSGPGRLGAALPGARRRACWPRRWPSAAQPFSGPRQFLAAVGDPTAQPAEQRAGPIGSWRCRCTARRTWPVLPEGTPVHPGWWRRPRPGALRASGAGRSAGQLLGRTLIVRDLAAARAIAAHASGFRLVTLQGELLEPDGTLTVGTHHAETGILSRKSELRELREQLADARPPRRRDRAGPGRSCASGWPALEDRDADPAGRDRRPGRAGGRPACARGTPSRQAPGPARGSVAEPR